MAHRVVALALPGLVTFDLGCALQIFGHSPTPEARPQLYDFTVCAPSGYRVATSDGFTLTVPRDLEVLAGADTVVVPGYHHAWDTPPPREALHALHAAAEQGARMLSICIGAFALGHAGLLDHRRATTHWAATGLLAAHFPAATVVDDVLYVDDGDVLTSAGLASGLDLALHLVRRDHGAAAAAELARWNVVAPHREGAQAQFISTAVPDTGESTLAATCRWALTHLERPLELADLAAHAQLSERSLLRHFRAEIGTSPRQWLLRARLDRARELLETTTLPIEDIARRAGFPTAAALRSRFTTTLGASPSAYRKSFNHRPDT